MTADRVHNLLLHGVGAPPPWVDADERRVWISHDGARSLLDQLGARTDVRLFLDDGNASDLALCLRELAPRGRSATVFVVTDRIGLPGYLDAEDLRTLQAAGFQIGSHGATHRVWRGLPDEELARELLGSRRVLDELLQAPVTAAACPLGRYDRRVLRRLREHGYRQVFTSDEGPARPASWLQGRHSLREHECGDVARLLAARPPARRALELAKRTAKRWR